MQNLPRFDYSLLPADVLKTLEQLRRKNIDFWLVGGFVRDWLAGNISHDIDMAALASPWKLARAIKGDVISCRHTIITKGNLQISPVRALDLAERDFNANAIAIDAAGRIIDPFGGMDDIRKKQLSLRASLGADPLRMLRGLRLAARLGWQLEPKTDRAFLKFVPRFNPRPESMLRVGLELRKSLDDPKPSLFLRKLRQYKLLKRACSPLHCLWNASEAAMEANFAKCDSLPAGNWDQRLIALLADSGDPARTAQRAYNYLLQIKWDLLASDFGKTDTRISHSREVATALLLQNGLPARENLASFGRSAQNIGHITVADIDSLCQRMPGLRISTDDVRRLARNLDQLIAEERLDINTMRACLHLAGMTKKAARRRLERLGQGPEPCPAGPTACVLP